MNKEFVKDLNKFLENIYMNIDYFEKYVKKCNDYNVKSRLQNIQKDYKLHALKVYETLQYLGGFSMSNSKFENNTIDFYPSYSQLENNINANTFQDIIEAAYNLSSTCYIMCSELVANNNAIDHNNYKLLNLMLKDYEKHMNSLSTYDSIH